MIDKPSIYIIIPAYNENETIQSVVHELKQNGYSNIVVVDDGSSNPIRDSLEGMEIYCLEHKANLGQGAALQTGLTFSLLQGADVFITFDADGQHDATDIKKLIEPVLNGSADIVFGSRFLGKAMDLTKGRSILLKMAKFINYLLTGLDMTDAHNGIRALNRKSVEFLHLRENRMAHASEILMEVKRHHLKWKEVPVTIMYTDYSRQKGQRSTEGIKILFDIFLHKLFK